MKDVKMVYVLLDGIGDLPHPSLNDLTPLEAAFTPNLDALARNGAMGRVISSEEAKAICKTLRDGIRFSDKDASVALEPTVAHRVVIRLRYSKMKLSDKITNTDPAYDKVDGMGIAKATTDDEMYVQKSEAQENTEQARTAAKMLNEFTERVVQLLRDHPVNRARAAAGKKAMNCILARDSGNRYPSVEPR